MNNRKFSIAIFTEDKIGLLSRITSVFTRRHISIESLTVSESEIHGVYRFTVSCHSTRELAKKIVGQLEKLIEVIKSDVYEDEEIIYQEIALYKVPTEALTKSDKIEKLVRVHNARILYVGLEVIVIEKTGYKEETQTLFKELEPFGLLEFVRSGRVAINKTSDNLHSYLEKLQKSYEPLILNAFNHGKN